MPLPSRIVGLGSAVSSPSGVWGIAPAGGIAQLLTIFGHHIRNFLLFHACFSAFCNVTGKANKTAPIRQLLPAIGLEGARAPVRVHQTPL